MAIPIALRRALKRSRLWNYVARSPLRPVYWRSSCRAAMILWFAYGHLKSVRTGSAIDAAGDPLPWYTYPAIEFLRQFDFSNSRVFEYGAGNSTLFWATRAAAVVSVEDEEGWYGRLRSLVPSNCTLVYEPDLKRYPETINKFSEPFDLIVVDGPARTRTRLKCARAAVQRLKPGGLIILDNADWLPESARFLRESDLLQIDMSGFIPIGAHTQTTSLFFHRDCRLRLRSDRQPLPSAGARLKNWEISNQPIGKSVEWEGASIPANLRDEMIEKLAPGGVRHFRIIVGDTSPSGPALHVLDVELGRILLGPVFGSHSAHEAEIRKLRGLSWNEFAAYSQNHASRRYILPSANGLSE